MKYIAAFLSFSLGLSLICYAGYSHLVSDFESNITVLAEEDLTSLIPENSVTVVEEIEITEDFAEAETAKQYPVTIALVGSDTRSGQGSGFGKAGGARSDTTILVRFNAERTHAVVMSIPRDLRVEIPACEKADGSKLRPQTTKFNAAYAFAGANCMIDTLKHNFGIEVNHIAIVSFLGFQDIIDIIGGVEICLAKDAYDKDAKLDLEAGRQTLMGEDALAFVRARKGLGDGSDISRTERQRMFLSSALQKAENTGVFFNPLKLYNILISISKSLTTNTEFANVDKMLEIALDAGRIGSKNFQSVPVKWQSNGDGSISFTEEGLEIIEQFNSYQFPITIQKETASDESLIPKTQLQPGLNPAEQESKFEKIGFSGDLDLCEANIR
jgi:LCP family protein required for cell wall assembly